MFKSILVVCIGNICRSPMAEALLKQALIAANKPDTAVSSAGLGALVGHPADPHSSELMLAKGLDISGHKARQLDKDMIRQADLILVMEAQHKAAIEDHMPSAKGKVFRLGEWGSFDIPDPYRQNQSAFLTALTLIEQGVSQWLNKL